MIKVLCSTVDSVYTSEYYPDICCGELLRNCCVNLGIDPEMEDGVVLNIDVFIDLLENDSWIPWKYHPSHRIEKYCNGNNNMLLLRLQEKVRN